MQKSLVLFLPAFFTIQLTTQFVSLELDTDVSTTKSFSGDILAQSNKKNLSGAGLAQLVVSLTCPKLSRACPG